MASKKKKTDRATKHEQCWPQAAHFFLMQGCDDDAFTHVFVRIIFFETRHNRAHLRLGLMQCHAGFQSREEVERPRRTHCRRSTNSD